MGLVQKDEKIENLNIPGLDESGFGVGFLLLGVVAIVLSILGCCAAQKQVGNLCIRVALVDGEERLEDVEGGHFEANVRRDSLQETDRKALESGDRINDCKPEIKVFLKD